MYLIQGLDPGPTEFGSAEYLDGVARRAEELGFDSIWLPEHVAMPADYTSRYPYQDYSDNQQFKPHPWADAEFPDPITAMAFIGARTHRLQLRTGALILPLRNPVILAKELATLDRLVEGRCGRAHPRDGSLGAGPYRIGHPVPTLRGGLSSMSIHLARASTITLRWTIARVS